MAKYYNFDKIMSYNAIFNYLIGGRGLGKTYGWKYKVISAAIKRGSEFVYIRRYKEELKLSKDTFFADIAHEFPEWDFRTHGEFAQMAPIETRDDKKRAWKTIGYFMPLSTAQSRKSVSYPNVKEIGFDEFIIEKGLTRYLPNEAIVFLNLYSTIARRRDNVRVFFMANSVSIMNPYFLYYDIKPDQVGEFYKSHEGFIVCHFVDSADYKDEIYATRFGRFIQGTEYADYAVESQFVDSHEALLQGKPETARYFFTLETKAGVFSVWVDWNTRTYYIQSKRPKQETLYTIIPEQMGDGKRLLSYSDKTLQYMRSAFNNDRARFDSPQTRNAMIEIFRR